MPWILGAGFKDIYAFYFLPALFVAIGFLFPQLLTLPLLGLIIYQWFDVGHAFPTAFRAFPRWGTSLLYSAWLPGMIFALLCLGFFLAPVVTAIAIVYFTVFHHIRQFYGICRWYQHLNNHLSRASGWFIYLLTILPLILLHFRTDLNLSSFAGFEVPRFTNRYILLVVQLVYAGTLIAWAIFEWRSSLSRKFEANRVMSILFPALLHFWCFTQAATLETILFPPLIIHAVTYFFVVARASAKKDVNQHSYLFKVVVVALMGGLFIGFIEDTGLELKSAGWAAPLLAIAFTPAIWHYLIDGFVWKRADMVVTSNSGIN
jgi:hypothetical protein